MMRRSLSKTRGPGLRFRFRACPSGHIAAADTRSAATFGQAAKRLVLGLTALLVLAAVTRHSRTLAARHHQATQRYEDLYYLPPVDWLEVGVLGYREAGAALVWLEALINFGRELQHGGPVRYFFHYADAILALDPHFRRVYLWAGSLALYRPKEVSLQDCSRALAYLKRAHSLFPDDGEIAWQLGATYFYELPPLLGSDKARTQARRDGLDYLEAAALLGAGPEWIGLNAASAMTRLGRTDQAIRHLLEIYTTVDDPDTKAEIEARLLHLRDERFVEGMRLADRQLRRGHQRDFPYLTSSMYVLLGPRPPLDGAAQLARFFDPVPAIDL